ncbi:MAG: 4Fe-4S dicluster domain-containing protein [Planctomycetes bacterium]|nr:4Fe-4S dicluster domain-containing protein [Planctomycetota bacterium]
MVAPCIQCGTCTASCPASHAMDLSPRRIVAALRAGQRDTVLSSRSLWLCASCYACVVRCPSGIPFTDVAYALKREAARTGVDDRRGSALARAFVRVADRLGRSAETELLLRYWLSTNPLRAIAALPLAFRLWRRGRLSLFGRGIVGRQDLQRMMAALERPGSGA